MMDGESLLVPVRDKCLAPDWVSQLVCRRPAAKVIGGLIRSPKRRAPKRIAFAVEKLGNKPQALVHIRTLLPRHSHLPLLQKLAV
jgi:hypothetical protein